MNEIRFLHTNKRRWEEFEQLIDKGYQANPDKICDLYIQLTDDLSYARTYFPGTTTVAYLNQLTQKTHHLIYQHQPVKTNNIVKFWQCHFPLLVYTCRKEIFISLAIFIVAVLIGWVSGRHDPDFVNVILGEKYVNMTLANMENDDPMAVYKSMNQVSMFLGISLNNIYVSFLAFVCGIFTALGTGFILLKNGIMIGAFQDFFAQQGFLLEAVSTIWIHGTLEIFCIIVAGAAGIVMGNSFLFPGTYTRLHAFRIGATRGIKLVTGLIPFFLLAAFLEGFITRYSHAPYVLKFAIIGLSLALIVFYFIYYPYKLHQKNKNHGTAS